MSAICLDCLEEFYTDADELIGYPTLDASPISIPRSDGDWLRNFGYLYESLAAFQMKTVNVMSYKAFLEKHSDHRIYSEDYDGEPDEIMSELGNALDNDLLTRFNYNTSEFQNLFYEIECKTCGVVTRLDHETPIKILPFETTKLTVAEQEKFFERILDYESANDNYIYSFELLWGDNFFANLYHFISIHLGHELYARCSSSCDHSETFVTSDEMSTIFSEKEQNLKKRIEDLLLAKTISRLKEVFAEDGLEPVGDDSFEFRSRCILSAIREQLISSYRCIDEIRDEHIIEVFIKNGGKIEI